MDCKIRPLARAINLEKSHIYNIQQAFFKRESLNR